MRHGDVPLSSASSAWLGLTGLVLCRGGHQCMRCKVGEIRLNLDLKTEEANIEYDDFQDI